PGATNAPSRSITRVPGPAQGSTSRFEPTATMRWPRIATASGRRPCRPPVQTGPEGSTMSAYGPPCAHAAPPPSAAAAPTPPARGRAGPGQHVAGRADREDALAEDRDRFRATALPSPRPDGARVQPDVRVRTPLRPRRAPAERGRRADADAEHLQHAAAVQPV